MSHAIRRDNVILTPFDSRLVIRNIGSNTLMECRELYLAGTV